MTDYIELIEQTIVDQALIFPEALAAYESGKIGPYSLADVLRIAVRDVPFYRDRVPGNVPNLKEFPLTSKADLRDNFNDLISDDIVPSRARIGYTSGSTGIPVRVVHDFEHFAWEAALAVQRTQALGLPARRRILAPMKSMDLRWMEYPSPWLWHSTVAEFGAPDGRLTAENARAAVLFQPHVVYGHPSECLTFARELSSFGDAVEPSVVSTFGERLSDSAREELSARLGGAAVIDGYAMYEFGTIADQCIKGTYHLIPGKVIVEVLDGENAVAEGEVGDLVITGLTNISQPLIRYVTGDRGAVTHTECACGVSGGALVELLGRSRPNVIVRGDVVRVDALTRVMKRLPVRRFQLVVTTGDAVEIRYDAGEPISDETERTVRATLSPTSVVPVTFRRVRGPDEWVISGTAKHRDFVDLRDSDIAL